MTQTTLTILTLGGLLALLAYWLLTDQDFGYFGENDDD